MQERAHTIDLMKGMAALLMIQVHIIELFANEAVSNSTIGKILLFLGGPPVAPLFLFFMGYFIANSQKSTLVMVLRGVKTFVLGLALNIALNLNLFLSVYKGTYSVNIWQYIFGVDVLPHAGLAIIIIALLRKMLDKTFLIPIILAISIAALAEGIKGSPQSSFELYSLAFVYGNGSWSYFPLFPWLAYSFAGYAFYKIKQHYDFSILNSNVSKVIVLLMFTLFLLFTGQYAVLIASNLQAYYHHGLKYCIWILFFLMLYGVSTNGLLQLTGTNKLFRYLEWLGRNITVIYVIQWIVIGNAATEVFKTMMSPIALVISFVIVLAVSSLVCYLWENAKKSRV